MGTGRHRGNKPHLIQLYTTLYFNIQKSGAHKMYHPFLTDKEIETLRMKARKEAEIEVSLRYREGDKRRVKKQKELEERYFYEYTCPH